LDFCNEKLIRAAEMCYIIFYEAEGSFLRHFLFGNPLGIEFLRDNSDRFR